MAFVTRDGATIHYEIVGGSGDSVVLMHGLFSDSREWVRRGVTEILGEGFAFVLIDAIGHGNSDKPHERERYGLEARARDIVAVLDDAGIERAHAAGYSMGGWTACGLAAVAPERFRSLVLGGWDPVGGIERFLHRALEQSGIAMTYERLVSIVSADPDLAANIASGDDEAFRCAYDVLGDFTDAEATLTRTALPLLFYCGDQDPYFEPTRAAASRIPGAEFATVPGADHVAVPRRVDAVGPVVRSFLERVG
jgi:pimeloyl-ACP methyl ester carboxylesterase